VSSDREGRRRAGFRSIVFQAEDSSIRLRLRGLPQRRALSSSLMRNRRGDLSLPLDLRHSDPGHSQGHDHSSLRAVRSRVIRIASLCDRGVIHSQGRRLARNRAFNRVLNPISGHGMGRV